VNIKDGVANLTVKDSETKNIQAIRSVLKEIVFSLPVFDGLDIQTRKNPDIGAIAASWLTKKNKRVTKETKRIHNTSRFTDVSSNIRNGLLLSQRPKTT
jgi:hypothetical protein